MLHLEAITSENWREAVFISTDPEHLCPLDEQWVTSSAFSMLQAIYEPQWCCRLILDDDEPVGLAFYGMAEVADWKGPALCRYAIDVDHQGKGYGRAALPLVVEAIRKEFDTSDVYLTLEATNERAVHLYRSFGFVPAGVEDEGEQLWVLR